jgi:hypothetical protein
MAVTVQSFGFFTAEHAESAELAKTLFQLEASFLIFSAVSAPSAVRERRDI